MNNEEIVLQTLQGQFETSKWAIPRVVKIFVATTRNDFKEERKCLLENIGPDLQTIYDSTGIEVEIVDMHYGSTCDPLKDSVQYADQLQEISLCQQISRGCFFLCLLGNDWQPAPLPLEMDEILYESIKSVLPELNLDVSLLENSFIRKPNQTNYVLNKEFTVEADVIENTTKAIREAANVLSNRGYPVDSQLLHSAVEHQVQCALELDPDHMIAVMREYTEDPDKTQFTEERFLSYKNYLRSQIPNDNLIHLCVRWRTNGINPACAEHDTYLTIFQEAVMSVLQTLINDSIEQKPEVNARNKAIQEVFKECLIHIAYCGQLMDEPVIDWVDSPLLKMIRTMIESANSKHGPIIIQGGHGTGKTSLITTIYSCAKDWFGDNLIRIVRFCGTTPRSSYNLELLRIICEQLNLLMQPDGLCVPRDASFDPLYVYNWFQILLRRFDGEPTPLIILVDDLHQLNPLDSDIVAALSWLPTTLPANIHIVCTSLWTPEALKMTPPQRERFRNSDLYIELPSPDTDALECEIVTELEQLEEQFGEEAIARFSSFVTISEFGLSETEMLELLMPTTGGIDCVLRLENGYFNFSTYSIVKRAFSTLLMEKFMSGRLLLCWRHRLTYNIMRKRYLTSQESQKSLHGEIVNLFFSEFNLNDSETEEKKESDCPAPDQEKQTPFQSSLPTNDVRYSLRHVEESWIHLLKAGDNVRMKELTLCNFDFLLASVRTISVSYLRSILEHARFYLLDRDVELIYYTVRKASDALTRDTLQLGAQIVCWLKPVSGSSDLINRILLSAMAWCDGYTDPLLVPLNDWLQPPLPLFVKCVTCGVPVSKIQPTPSAQHVVIVPVTGDPQLWHAMSNTLVHTFKGHSGAVACLTVTSDSQFLLTGSEDTSVIVWNLKTFELKMRLTEHIASVLCVTCALKDTLIISGGEDSRIIVSSLTTGEVINKIDHHRGPVTQVLFTPIGDVLVSGSVDKSVCIWDLESYTLQNTINFTSPVITMEMSADSIFLSIVCEDNQINLHCVATGTFIHTLRGHKSKVTTINLANDNQRAMAGGTDSRVYVFDIRGGSLLRTIITTPHHSQISCVKVTKNDDFLVTAGENRIAYWNFRDAGLVESENKLRKANVQTHLVPITCVQISVDGTIAVTGATDGLVNVWHLNSHELQSTMEGHSGAVTCLAISPNGLFVVSGSDDKTARVWGLTLGIGVCSYTGHQSTVIDVHVMSDSRRAVSTDKLGNLAIWAADNGTKLFTAKGPTNFLAVTFNMKYIICGDDDNCLQIWPVGSIKEEERYTVSHSEEITCFALTYDSLHIITGSKDMSLKVWQVTGGKLAQVLVGHSDLVSCVSVAITKKSVVVSGSWDTNLIIWDIDTGADLHLLSGHLGHVTCVKLTGDGTLAVSGSADKRIIVWDCERGLPLSTLLLHVPILGLVMSSDVSRVAVHLYESQHLPIICLHNTPATYVKAPVYVAPTIEDLRPSAPKRPNRRLLKKDVSLDSYTWQRKYAHLTSSLMMAAVDERLKRRFSVSASMEEISTISSSKDSTMGSQGLGPEQAALAQSQHFDQLKALWNKKSPPRSRRNLHSLSKQNSRSSRHSTDNDEFSMAEEDADISHSTESARDEMELNDEDYTYVRTKRPPNLKFKVGQVVLNKEVVYIGIIIGWFVDKTDLSKEPIYEILVDHPKIAEYKTRCLQHKLISMDYVQLRFFEITGQSIDRLVIHCTIIGIIDLQILLEQGGEPFEIMDTSELMKYEKIEKGEQNQYLGDIAFGPSRVSLNIKYLSLAEAILHMDVRKSDVFTLGIPRSGTTWTDEMVWLLSNNLDYETAKNRSLSERILFLESESTSPWLPLTLDTIIKYPSRRFIKTHLPVELLPLQIEKVKPKLVYVYRNPKDVVISHYHILKTFKMGPFSFEVFAEEFIAGKNLYGPYWSHVLGFWKLRETYNILFLNYDEMLQDLGNVINTVSNYLEVTIGKEDLVRLMDHLDFNSMKRNPSVNLEKQLMSLNFISKPEESNFIRNGKSREWETVMAVEMVDKFDKWSKEALAGSDFPFYY